MSWYLAVLKKYATFSGRARRTEFWMFFLINFVVGLLLGVVDSILGSQVLQTIYSLAVLLPGLAVTVRRLHDIGKSGWWVLIGLIPIVGAIVLIVFAVKDGQPGANEHGPNPKEVVATTVAA